MKFFMLCLLPMAVSAAILPDAIGPYHRTATSQPALTDTAIWNEYGLKASEAGTYESDKTKFTATAWRLQDPTGALAAFDWQRPAQSTPLAAAKLGAETKNGVLLAHGNYLVS